MTFFFLALILILLVLCIFFLSSKSEKWDYLSSSTFECGFSSYFFSRFSFSIHYFVVALIFLFLDLELCFIMPFFKEFSMSLVNIFSIFVVIFILLAGLLWEWKKGKVEWIF